MKKSVLLLLMFVSCCTIPLSAATLSDGRCVAMRQTVCDDYDEEPSVRKDDNRNWADTADDMYAFGNRNGDGEVEEDDNDNNYNDATDIFTTGVVVQDIDSLNLTEIDDVFFKKMQAELLTYVQKTNWETDLNFTPRDTDLLLHMCKYVCQRVNYVYQGFIGRRNDQFAYRRSQKTADKIATKITKTVGDASRKHMCNYIMCLTTEELVRIIEVENPFVLFAIDLDTFKEAISIEPEVANLYKNMFKFFKDRATLVGGDYSQNTKELLRVSRPGEDGYFETWKELAQFAQHSKEQDSKGQLNPKTEMAAQIKILEVAMLHIADQTKVKREVAKQLKKDPANRAAANELKRNIKRPTQKQRAIDYLNNNTMTVDEAAKWIRKY